MNILGKRRIALPSAAASGLGAAALLGGVLAVHSPRAMAPLAGVAAILCLAQMAGQRTPGMLKAAGLGGLLAVLLVWMFASTAWGLDGAPLLDHAARKAPMIAVIILMVAMARSVAPGDGAWFNKCLTMGFAALMAVAAFELLSHGWILRTVAPANLKGAPWRDVYVGRGLIIMSLMLWPALIALRHRHAAILAATICGAVAVSLLGSHDATRMALAFGIVVFALTYRFGKGAVLTVGAICVAFILVAPLLSYGPLSPDIADSDYWTLKNSATHRLYIWQFVSDRVWDRPWLGWGMGASRYIPGGDLATPVGGTFISLHPHSAPLQLWLELGVVGALLGAAIVARTAWLIASIRADRFQRAAATAALAAAFSVGAVGFGLWQSWWLATLGLVAAWCVTLISSGGTAESKT